MDSNSNGLLHNLFKFQLTQILSHTQFSSTKAQIQLNARMNHKSALKDMQMGFNAPRNEWELLRQEQVGRQINISVLFLKNEVELSIYKFLTTRTKKTKKQPQSIELGSTGSLAVRAFNAWQVTVTLNRRSIGKANTLTGKTNTSIEKREPVD